MKLDDELETYLCDVSRFYALTNKNACGVWNIEKSSVFNFTCPLWIVDNIEKYLCACIFGVDVARSCNIDSRDYNDRLIR